MGRLKFAIEGSIGGCWWSPCSHTLLATKRKRGINAFDSLRPNAGAIAFLCRLWTSPSAHTRPLSSRTAINSRLAADSTHMSWERRIWEIALGSAVHRRSSCPERHLSKSRSGRNVCPIFQGSTYPESPFPTHDAAVCGQIMVFELAWFSIFQRQQMSCNIPCSRT